MKLRDFIIMGAFGLLSGVIFAQQPDSPFGTGQDSIKCRQSLSLLTSYAKAGSYADAYPAWQEAFDKCPASSKNIYIFGPKIIRWKISQESDASKKKALMDLLMNVYDQRIKYFGNDPRYGTDVIIGAKAAEYISLQGSAADYNLVYSWIQPIVKEYKEKTSPQTLYYFTYASQVLARADEKKIPDYINDFMEADGYINAQLSAATGNDALIKTIGAYKTSIESEFASSGLASCDILKKVYTPESIEKNKSNKEYLTMVTDLFVSASCEAPVYFQASKYLFDLDPTAKAAMGLAGESISKKDYSSANEWLKKAVELSKDSDDRAKCYELLAQIAQSQNNMSGAISYSNKALEENPKSGKSYILIAQMIASSAPSLFPNDPVKQRCVYYLVLDKLAKAASVDPSVASRANSLAATYRKSLPTASQIFMHPDLSKGQSFSCGSWGTTTIR